MKEEKLMLTDEEFLAFLNDKELDGSLEENLSKIIDDEMEKPEEERLNSDK